MSKFIYDLRYHGLRCAFGNLFLTIGMLIIGMRINRVKNARFTYYRKAK